MDRTLEAVEQLQGAALPASALERDVLPVRVAGYTPAWLDELAASGEIVWVGRGPLGTDDGKLALYLRDAAPLLIPRPADPDETTSTPLHQALLTHLAARGASFWPALYEAALRAVSPSSGEAPGSPDRSHNQQAGTTERDVVAALWDLVWAGLVTNDGLAPLRALVGGGSVRRPRGGGRRRRPGRGVARSGPPAAAGRWSLVADLTAVPAATERAAALTATLLDRHGVLTRDAVAAEDVPGGFSAVYPVLRAMEDAGRARRGYFVEGLGAAQFALPGAVDRLRSTRDASREPEAVVLAASDPANAYGAALPWPQPPPAVRQRPRRVAGAHVVLVDGHLALFAERGGRSLLTFPVALDTGADPLELAIGALADLVRTGRVPSLRVSRVNGEALTASPVLPLLRAAGFVDTPQGLLLR